MFCLLPQNNNPLTRCIMVYIRMSKIPQTDVKIPATKTVVACHMLSMYIIGKAW